MRKNILIVILFILVSSVCWTEECYFITAKQLFEIQAIAMYADHSKQFFDLQDKIIELKQSQKSKVSYETMLKYRDYPIAENINWLPEARKIMEAKKKDIDEKLSNLSGRIDLLEMRIIKLEGKK